MAAAIVSELGAKVELVKGDHGIFDVAVNAEVVFSKQRTGDFLATPEIVQLVRERVEKP